MKKRVEIHNREVVASAESRALKMRAFPSPLEERMIAFLEKNWIMYESQKIFYIYDVDMWIIKYYIADFFLPDYNLIIEVDGKQHDKHKLYDKYRTRAIQEQYPDIEVLRYTWKDLSDEDTMQKLLYRLI